MKLLVWTGAMMVVAPLAGFFSERYGSRLFMVAGLALQAIALGWMASVAGVGRVYASLMIPFALAGSGMALVFAPAANAVLASVRTDAGRAGVGRHQRDPRARRRARASRCSPRCSRATAATCSPQAFVNGLVPALWVGAAVLAAGALIAAVLPFSTRASASAHAAEEAAMTTGEASTESSPA